MKIYEVFFGLRFWGVLWGAPIKLVEKELQTINLTNHHKNSNNFQARSKLKVPINFQLNKALKVEIKIISIENSLIQLFRKSFS
jgi:hypothetical protein